MTPKKGELCHDSVGGDPTVLFHKSPRELWSYSFFNYDRWRLPFPSGYHRLVSAEALEPFHGKDPWKTGVYEMYKVGRPKVGYPWAWQFLSVHQDGVVETVNSRDCDPQAFIE